LKDVNKTITEAYILANVHVARLCEEGSQTPILDHSFFYGFLSAMSVSNRPKTAAIKNESFMRSDTQYKSWRPRDYKPPNSSYLSSEWYQQASMQMATNATNAASLNFFRRFKRYLQQRYALESKQAYLVMKHVRAQEYNGSDTLILRYRAKFPRSSKIEHEPHLCIPLLYKFLKYCEFRHPLTEYTKEAKQLRLFRLIPFKQGFHCSHLKVCNNGLRGLLKRGGFSVPPNGPQ
uniref:Uncharacterized protein n=1 Tax=Globisporangium ultimum (strain ATCC 200006 / CBS 805.95 / DAOM BR144) TaxID=431595 RepID=K3X2S8_GLOUD